jgi:hypothetical protein
VTLPDRLVRHRAARSCRGPPSSKTDPEEDDRMASRRRSE